MRNIGFELFARITAFRIKRRGEDINYYIDLMGLEDGQKPRELIIRAFTLLRDCRPSVRSKIISYAAQHFNTGNSKHTSLYGTVKEYLGAIGIPVDYTQLNYIAELEKGNIKSVLDGFKCNPHKVIFAFKYLEHNGAKCFLMNEYMPDKNTIDIATSYLQICGLPPDEINQLQERWEEHLRRLREQEPKYDEPEMPYNWDDPLHEEGISINDEYHCPGSCSTCTLHRCIQEM
jgi:hypothetical protein